MQAGGGQALRREPGAPRVGAELRGRPGTPQELYEHPPCLARGGWGCCPSISHAVGGGGQVEAPPGLTWLSGDSAS